MAKNIVFALFSALLFACAPASDDKPESSAVENAYSTQLDALDKAKSVEQQLRKNAEQRRLEIEQKGG